MLHSHEPIAAAAFTGDIAKSVWLPNEIFARKWTEYVQIGAVSDDTPPPVPHDVTVGTGEQGELIINWSAEADFESGLRQFIILSDGKEIGRVPPEPTNKFGRPLFQGMSYHDTPIAPLPVMEFADDNSVTAEAKVYSVISINGVGLESEPLTVSVDE